MFKTPPELQQVHPVVVSHTKMICGKCNLVISPEKNAPRCSACEQYFHGGSCIKLKCKSWGKMDVPRRTNWKCPTCRESETDDDSSVNGESLVDNSFAPLQSVSVVGQPPSAPMQSQPALATTPASLSSRATKRLRHSPEDVSLLSSLGLDLDMAAFEDASQPAGIKNLTCMMVYLIKEVKGINVKFEKLNAEVETLKATVRTLQAENKVLKRNQDQTDVKSSTAAYERRLLNDYSRVDNLVLHGGPKAVTSEDSFALFHAVAAEYGVVLNRSDVSICHPLPSKGTVNRQICKFARRSVKLEILLASKKKRLTSKSLKWTNVEPAVLNKPVFVTEHLSPETARLLAESKKKLSVAADGPYTHVWCKQGRVLVRSEGDRGRPIEVKHFIDIIEIYQHAVDNGFRPKQSSEHVEYMDETPCQSQASGQTGGT